MAHRQHMVGFGDKLLPLTGRAWRGSETEARPPHQSQLACGTETSPPERRGSRSDWRV